MRLIMLIKIIPLVGAVSQNLIKKLMFILKLCVSATSNIPLDSMLFQFLFSTVLNSHVLMRPVF